MELFGYFDIGFGIIVLCSVIWLSLNFLVMELGERVFYKGKNIPDLYVWIPLIGISIFTIWIGACLIGVMLNG